MFDAQLYRTKDEIEAWRKRGPIVRIPGLAPGQRPAASRTKSTRIEAEVEAEIEPPWPSPRPARSEPVEDLERFVSMDEVPA